MTSQDKTNQGLENTLKDYVQVQYKIVNLEIVDRLSSMGAIALSGTVLVICLVLVLVFVSAAGAILLSQALGSLALGLGIVAGFYSVVFLLLLVFRQRGMKALTKDRIINELLRGKESSQ